MKIFMLGWEFPPYISGGLGTACHGLTRALNELGAEITFVLPKPIETPQATHVKMLSPSQLRQSRTHRSETVIESTEELKNVTFRQIESMLEPYATPERYQQKIEEILKQKSSQSKFIDTEQDAALGQWEQLAHQSVGSGQYTGNMYTDVQRYAAAAARLALQEDFDVIHAHDWMTYPAGIAVASVTGKPLVVHVHSTEFDRSGECVNQMIYDIERRGMHAAQKIIAVSYFSPEYPDGRAVLLIDGKVKWLDNESFQIYLSEDVNARFAAALKEKEAHLHYPPQHE